MKFIKVSFSILLGLFFTLSVYPQTTDTVQASNYVFTPANLTITKGDTVLWVWIVGMHTTTSDSTAGIEVWNSPLDQTHQSFRKVFTHSGTFPYKCSFHYAIGMVGTVTVQEPTAVISNNQQPYKFQLDQNYPNPFNPSTKIEFQIAKPGLVSLKVYNVLGEKVATLVNENKQPGTYSIEFEGNNYPSGIYFYKIETNGFTAVHKMLLLK